MSAEALQVPQEVHHRRAADAISATIRRQAVVVVFDGVVDRRVGAATLTLEDVERICVEYENRLRALGGW